MENGSILGFAINFIEDILAWAEVFFFMTKILMMKPSKKAVNWIVVGALMVGGWLWSSTSNCEWLKPWVLTMCVCISSLVCINGKIKDRVIFTLFIFFYQYIVDSIPSFILFLISIYKGSLINYAVINIFPGVFNLCLVWLFAHFLKNRSSYIDWVHKVNRKIFILWTVCFAVFSSVSSVIEEFSVGESTKVAIIVEAFRICMSIMVLSIYVFFMIIDMLRMQYKNESEVKSIYLQMSKEHYKRLETHINTIRRIKHDMKAQLLAIRQLISEKDCENAIEYIDTALGHQNSASNNIFMTGNELIDAVLAGILVDGGINVQCNGKLENSNIVDYDLCIIFSNLVTNAVEAVNKLVTKEKRIDIDLKHYGEYLLINVRNPIEWNVDIKNIGLYTTKSDGEHHGFGIRNVVDVVKKYGGDIKFESDNDVFCAKLRINKHI